MPIKTTVPAQTAETEAERLAALYRYEVLDTPPEASFDLLTSLAAELFSVPISLITLLDPTRQFFKSRYGVDARESPREVAFCEHAILSSEVMVVTDAAKDPRFAANPMVVSDPKIRFYAGAPLETYDGFRLGTLCVIDHQPRQPPEPSLLNALRVLAKQAVELLEFHRAKRQLIEGRDTLAARSRELEHSEARFRSFMEHNPCLSFIADEDCRILYANSACERMWQLMPGQSLGKLPEELLPPAAAAHVRKTDLALLAAGAASETTEAMKTPDGVLHQFLTTKFTFPMASGRKALGGFAIDTTERVQSEERLRASEIRYRELFERNPVPCWIYATGDLRIVDVNQAAINHYGWSRDEFVGSSVSGISIPGEPEAILRHRRKNRSDIWVEVSSVEIEAEGRPARLMMANDITDRIESQNRLEALVAHRTAELQKSEAKWRSLVEALPQFVWSTTPEGVTEYMSNQWAEFTGVPLTELLGSGWLKTVHPEDRPPVEARVHAWAKREKRGSFDIEYRIRSKDGAYRWFVSRGRPVCEVDGGPITQWLGTTTDIDDRKRGAEILEAAVAERTLALEEARERAESAARVKSEFLAVISHELRTPMNGVIGMAHLMEDTPLTTEQRECLSTIQSSGQALLNLINDVLDLSKIEAGKMQLENAEFCLKTVLDESLELVSLAAAAKDLELSLALAADVPLKVVGDAGRLRQILLNLLSNAVKFTERGSVRVAVTLEASKSQVVTLRFSVRDTGIGLSLEQQGRLFMAFAQADSSTTRRFGGTGLGLCIAKRLVELMGGTIGVYSQLGQGATFWLNLCLEPAPVHSESPEPAPPQPEQSVEPGAHTVRLARQANEGVLRGRFASRRARVLLADDNVSNQLVAQGILRKMGVYADCVANGAEALAALDGIPYDLVLMDVHMPGMDGLEATRRIRALGISRSGDHRLPVIALTASAMQSDREECFAAGMDDFISKPLMPRILADVLEKWLPREDREESAVFNMTALLERLMGDRELTNRVLEGYLRDMPKQLQALSQLLDAGGLREVRNQVHKMSGASATVGGKALLSALSGMATAAKASDLEGARASLQEVSAQFERLKDAIAIER